MRVLLIHGGVVVGTIAGMSLADVERDNPTHTAVEDTFGIERVIGMSYAAGQLSGEATPELAPAPTVPQTVSIYAAELVLLQAGHLAMVQAALEAAGPLAQLAWQRRLNVRRDDPLVAQLSAAFEWSDAYVDGLFIAAGAVQ